MNTEKTKSLLIIGRNRYQDILKKLALLITRNESQAAEEQSLLLSCLFDQPFYEQQCKHTFDNKLDAIRHYLSIGHKNNHNPNPLFDSKYYLSNNPDVAQSNINPLIHFIMFGAGESRNPNKFFDTDYYLSQLSDENSQVNALEHFLLNCVDNHGINPNQDFSVRNYYQNNPNVLCTEDNALVHFLQQVDTKPTLIQPVNKEETFPDYKKINVPATGPEKLILCSHDASRTGAPLIILKIAELLHTNHRINCIIILIRGGPLVAEFRKYGDVTVLDSSIQHRHKNIPEMRLKIASLINQKTSYTLCNSAESHFVINELAKHGLKVLSLIHEFADAYPYTLIEKIYQDSSKILLPADIVLQSLQSRFNHKLTKVEVLPQGIFTDKDYTQPTFDKASSQAAKEEILTELGLPETTKIVLGSGYVDNRKGCDYFMLTCQLIQSRQPQLDFAFIWVGQKNASFADSSFGFWLTTDHGKTSLDKHLFFVGEKEKPANYFLAADVFFMCSRLDPFPCVVLEALSAATPVVCFAKTTGSAELLKTGAGTVIEPFHLLEAADAICNYLNNDKLRTEAGIIGQQIIENDFQFIHYVDEIVLRLKDLGFENLLTKYSNIPDLNQDSI